DVPAARLPPSLQAARWTRARPALAAHVGVLLTCALILTAKVAITGNTRLSQTFGWVHLPHVLAILAVWMLLCAVFQRAIRFERWTWRIPYIWAATDVAILTVTMLLTDTFASPIAIGYPLMVAAAGLGLRGRLVWFTTGATILGYLGGMTALAVERQLH